MTDQQPDDENLFDGNEPTDIVPTTKHLDDETKQRLADANGQRVHLWTFRAATDHDGQPLSAGWRHEGSGTLASPRLDDDHDADDETA